MTSTKHTSVTVGTVACVAIVSAFFFVSAAFAETNGAGVPSAMHTTMMKHASSTPVDTACVQTALDTRETAIGAAFDTMQSAVKAGLTTRKSSLHDAWGLSDRTARRTAIKTAWAKWSSDNKAAQTALRTSRKTIWNTFQSTVKNTCKTSVPPEEGLGQDGVGKIAL
jgi:ribosomal protein S20